MKRSTKDKYLDKLKKKREDLKKIRNERGDITTNTTEIKTHKRLLWTINANKLDNLQEMEKFLQTYNMLRLNHEEIENMNRSITSKEIKSAILKLSTKKCPVPDGFTGEFHQTFKDNPSQTIPKIEEYTS